MGKSFQGQEKKVKRLKRKNPSFFGKKEAKKL